MKCILMNKNTKVLIAEYNENIKAFLKIYKIKNIEYAPVILYNLYTKNKDSNELLLQLTEWYKGRGIPNSREDLELLLEKLNVSAPSELLDKAFGLSLSDQYYIKPYNSKIQYKDINFFQNTFNFLEFTMVTFSNSLSNTKIDLISPNNTTDGRLRKAWIIENNKRYLLKGSYKNEVMQPFNEVLASTICKRMEFYHIPYTIYYRYYKW